MRGLLGGGLTLLFGVLGCGPATTAPTTYPVSGTASHQGAAVEGATVLFEPVGADVGAVSAQATTDAAGNYEMAMHVGGGEYQSGLLPGEYAVSISKLSIPEPLSEDNFVMKPPKQLLPVKYGSSRTSGLTATVKPDEENVFEFDLQ